MAATAGETLLSKDTALVYSESERARGSRIKLLDYLGIPVIVAWYFLISSWVAQAPVQGDDAAMPSSVLAAQGACAAFGVVVFVWHTMTWPPKADDDIFHAMAYIGRWLFLTRHCIALQAVHLVVSFAASARGDANLRSLSDGATLFVGSLGWFVTVQYFSLVHVNPEFKKKCETWAKFDPPALVLGLQLREFLALMHVPSLFLAALDAAVFKRHAALLGGACSLQDTCLLIAFYIVFYLFLIAVNYKFTGYWPYDVLKKLTDPLKWAGFLIVQIALLGIFCLVSYGLLYVPQFWF